MRQHANNRSCRTSRIAAVAAVAGVMSLLASGCGEQDEGAVLVWCHQGREAETLAMERMAAAFNEAHAEQRVRVHVEFFPDRQYDEKLSSAAAADALPDVIDIDGPMLARYVDAQLVQPIDRWVDAEMRADFLDSILEQGTIDGDLYALGAFESALVLYYDKQLFAEGGIEPPPEGEAWTWDEFLAASRKAKAAGLLPVAMHMGDPADEWFTYAFSPVLWSAGGRLIDAEAEKVEGVLNSAGNVAALQRWQMLFAENLADTDPVNPDPFAAGGVAMDWNGHWVARSHLEAKGERLGAMILPRMGEQPVVPSGSWCWGISASSDVPEKAALWLKWLVHPEQGIKPIVEANGAVPARQSAFALFPEYGEMPYRLFRDQLERYAHPRPRTRHYATLTQQFAAALRDIAHGADPAERLDKAAAAVERVIN